MSADFLAVAAAVLRRNLIHAFTNPALLVPSIVFPLLFLVAFAGGLSSVANVPGLRLPVGLHGLPVRLRVPAGGRLRRGVHRLLGRGRLRVGLRAAPAARPPRAARASSRATRSRPSARFLLTGTVVTVAALLAGHAGRRQPGTARRAGVARAAGQPHRDALGHRHGAALPDAAGRPGDADPRLPDPLHGAGLRAAAPDQAAGSTTPPRTTRSPRCSRPGAASSPGEPETVGLAYLGGLAPGRAGARLGVDGTSPRRARHVSAAYAARA